MGNQDLGTYVELYNAEVAQIRRGQSPKGSLGSGSSFQRAQTAETETIAHAQAMSHAPDMIFASARLLLILLETIIPQATKIENRREKTGRQWALKGIRVLLKSEIPYPGISQFHFILYQWHQWVLGISRTQ